MGIDVPSFSFSWGMGVEMFAIFGALDTLLRGRLYLFVGVI